MEDRIDYEKIIAPVITAQEKIDYNKAFLTIQTYSSAEFEEFILEWLKYPAQKLSQDSFISRVGGVGDKGVDIYYKNGSIVEYYQCKQYNRQLTFPEIEEIIGKILWKVDLVF